MCNVLEQVNFRINHHIIFALKHACCGSESLIRQSTLLCSSAHSQSVSSSKSHDCGYQVLSALQEMPSCKVVVRMSQSAVTKWNDYDYNLEALFALNMQLLPGLSHESNR